MDCSIVSRLTGSTDGRSGPLLKSRALARIPDAASGSFAKHGTVMITHTMMAVSTRHMELFVFTGMKWRVVSEVWRLKGMGIVSVRLGVGGMVHGF